MKNFDFLYYSFSNISYYKMVYNVFTRNKRELDSLKKYSRNMFSTMKTPKKNIIGTIMIPQTTT